MTHEHDVVMENWLAGKDLAYDHRNTGALGHHFYHELSKIFNEACSADLDPALLSPLSATQQSFDEYEIVRRAGFRVVLR